MSRRTTFAKGPVAVGHPETCHCIEDSAHPLRRKWVTERRGYPVKDVAVAGGWRDEQTMLRSYQHADADTVRQVVLHPTQRLASR